MTYDRISMFKLVQHGSDKLQPNLQSTIEVGMSTTTTFTTKIIGINVGLTLLSDIKDPIIRSFAKKRNKNGFWQLKKYATETEDRELEGKLAIVEKYNKRIPDLVRRLRSCSESDFDSAGMNAHTHYLKYLSQTAHNVNASK